MKMNRKAYIILATKELTLAQKMILIHADISMIEYNAITIEMIDFDVRFAIKNAIITSQNAAKIITAKNISIENGYCVGQKTTAILRAQGIKIVETALKSADLARKIISRHTGQHFVFLCGDKKREELPATLRKYDVSLEEITVYKTYLNNKKIKNTVDGILFFSPSAVESYMLKNTMANSIAFCIGATTASEARKHTENIIVAHQPTIENVLLHVVKQRGKYD